jgi:hypothetical protein
VLRAFTVRAVRRYGADAVAVGRLLDLHHVRSQRGELAGSQCRRDEDPEIEDLDSAEGLVTHRSSDRRLIPVIGG